MVEFKVGDVVRWKNKTRMENNDWQNFTIEEVSPEYYYGTDAISGYGGFCKEWELEHVSEVADRPKSTNPFLKTVTETRVVGGSHVFESSGADIQIEVGRNDVMIRTDAFYDKQSLAELARILAEISEAM